MSDANYSLLAFQRETTWGTLPGSPALKIQRLTGESLAHSKETITSEEIRADRQISDLAEVGAAASGSIDYELSNTDFRHWFEAALFGTIVDVNVAATIALNHTTQVMTGAAGDFDDVVAGCFIKIAGAATLGNNGVKLVTAKANDGSTLTLATGSLVATEASPSLTITAKQVKNGTQRHSYTVERRIQDSAGANHFQRFLGMMVDTMSLSIESKAICKGSIGLIGKTGTTESSALSAYTASSADPVLNGTSNVGALRKDGATMQEKFKSLSIEIKNNLRGKDAISEKGNFEVGVGSIEVTGSISAYFRDNTLLTAFINHDYTGLSMTLTDGAGGTIGIHLPRINFSTGNPAVTGKDTDVMTSLEYTAIRHAGYDATILLSWL